MKITCTVKELLRGLEEVSPIASVSLITDNRILLSVKDSIMLVAHEGHSTLLILTKVSGKIEEPGKCLLPYEDLKKLLRNQDSETLTILELKEKNLSVKFVGKNSRFQLSTEDSDYFPHLGLKKTEYQFDCDLEALKDALNRLRMKFQTAEQGFKLVRKDSNLSLQAFDGVAVLHEILLPIRVSTNFPNCMLSVETPGYLKSLSGNSCSVSIEEQGLVTIKTDNTVLMFTTLAVEYPDKLDSFGILEKQYLSKFTPLNIPINLIEFFKQIQTVSDFTDTEEIRIKIKDSKMLIRAQNNDKGLNAEIEMESDCEDLIFGLNPKLLVKSMKVSTSSKLEYIQNKAIIIRSDTENVILAIMRIIHDY